MSLLHKYKRMLGDMVLPKLLMAASVALLSFCLIYPIHSFAQTTYFSRVTGDWNVNSTWSTVSCGGVAAASFPGAGDDVIVCSGHTVTLIANTTINNLTVNTGGFIITDGKNMTVSGDLDVDGTYGDKDIMGSLTLSGSNATIDGIGTIAAKDGVFTTDGGSGGDKTILSTANLTVVKKFTIGNNLTVTNYGAISILDNLIGNTAASTWQNESNSTLNIGKNLLAGAGGGVLIASATDNTVNYNRAGAQNIKVAKDSTYYHLQAQGNNIKKLLDYTIVLGNLTIAATLDCDNFDMEIGGNWINSGGIFDEQTATVTFNGSGTQSVTNLLGETFYDLIFNKSGGILTLNDNVTVTNTLTMTQGIVDATSGTLTLGTACGSVGTLSHSSGTIIGKFERWVNATSPTTWLYPVGTDSYYRPALITFNPAGFSCGSLIGEFIATDPGSNGLPLDDGISPDSIRNTFVEGYWTLDTANGMASADYDLELTGNGFTSFTVNNVTRLLTRANSGNPWTTNGDHVPANPDTAKRDAITILSAQYCFGDTINCTGPSTGSISGPDSVCTDSAGAVYSVPNTVGSMYDWTVTGGTIAFGNGLNSITVNWGSTGMVGNVQVVENNGCTDGEPVNYTVNIHTLPTSSIIGNSSVGEFAAGEAYFVTGRSGYTYTWTITGGTQVTGGTTDSITVNWGTAGIGNVRVVASTDCGSAAPVDLQVTIFSTIISVQDGDWDQPTTWDCSCEPPQTGTALISTGDTVTLVEKTKINNFTINSAGTLDAAGNKLEVAGNLIVDGLYHEDLLGGNGDDQLKLKGLGTVTLGGTGSIYIPNNEMRIEGGNVNISSSANLTITVGNKGFFINKAGITVTNYGKITIVGDLTEKDLTSTWVNEANSTLNISGNLFTGAGVLVASATGNTVNYTGTAAQTVKCPNSGQYYHLTSSGSATKTLECNIDVDGNLTITGSSQLNITAGNNYSITLAGNWANSSSNGDPFLQQSGLVTIDGSGAQSISRTGGETFYKLRAFKSADTLTLNDNVVVSNTLTMNGGNIKNGTDTLTLGTSIANEGTLIRTAGTIVGRFQRWINTTGTGFLFPIGTSSYYRPALITFNPTLTGGALIGEFIETVPGINGLPLNDGGINIYNTFSEGFWSYTAANGLDISAGNYDLELTGNGFTSYPISPDGTRLITRPNAGSPWTVDGSHIATSGTTAKRNTITTLSAEYCFGDTAICAGPTPTGISGPDSVCVGDAGITYTASGGDPSDTYTWIITGGVLNPLVQTTQSVTVDWDPAPGQVGQVQVVESNNCGLGDTTSLSVNIHTLPTSSITGKNQGLSEFGPPEPYSVTCRPGYTYTWTIAQGNGTILSGQGTCNITVKWDFAGLDTVQVMASTGCDSAATVELPITIYGTIVSVQSGYWDTASTWDCVCEPLITDNVVIDTGHTVTLTVSDTINFLIISDSATLQNSTFTMTITGDYIVTGTHAGSGNIYLNGVGATIDGDSGTISNTGGVFINGSKTIVSVADITITSATVTIAAGDTVTNNGIMTIGGNIVGGSPASMWTNNPNSTLNIGGDMLTTGIFNASASGNTVNYNGSGAQTVKCPTSSGQYYHFATSGSGTKTLDCNIDVDGNLAITGSSTLDASVSNYNITLAGNWTDSSIFNPRNGTVFIDGSGAQSITNSTVGGETFYNLTVVKSADTLTLNGNVTVSNTSGGTLTMTSGNIDTGTDTLKLGTSCANVGSLSHTSGTVVGRFERWISSIVSPSPPVLFPVGATDNYRPALVTFNSLTSCGSLTGEFIASNPGNNGLPLNDGAFTIGNAFTEGYWSMTAGNGLVSTDYDLDLVGTGFSSYTIVSQTRLLKRINSGSGWSITDWGAHVAVVGDTAKRSGLNDISDFEFGFGDTTGCSNIPPTSIITGLDSVCTGQTGVAYTVDDHPPNTYTWIVIGGSITSGQNSNSIVVDWGSTGQIGIVRIIETDECDNRAPVDLSVDIHVLPTSAITGNTLIEQYTNGESYSVTNTPGYTYTWTVLGDSGTIATGQGSNSITVNWLGANSDTLQVVATNGGCGTPDTVILPVTIYGVIISVQTGNWDVPATWDCNCVPASTSNVIIDSTDTVTLVAITTINNFTIYSTGTLDNTIYAFTVSGNYTVNGTHSGTGAINLDGANIDGTGTITNAGFLRIRVVDKTIASTADLTKTTGSFVILGFLTVTNNGIMTIGGNIVEGGIGTSWVNSPGSTLNIGGTLLAGSGTLDAFGIGNTVEYNGSGAQTVKFPIAANYSHLTLSNSGTKTMPGVLDIDGNLTISGSANFATANYDFTLAGNWANDATFTAGTGTVTLDGTTLISGTSITSFNNVTISGNLTGPANDTINVAGNWNNSGTFTHNSGTVTFNGSSAQSITSTGGETFYNLEISNTSATGVSLNNAVTVIDSLTLTDGILYTTPANLLTLIDDAASTEGSINSFVSGPMRKIGDDAFVFPIGDADSTIWARLAISAPSINTTEYTARYFFVIYSDTSTDITLNNVSGIEYWTLEQAVNDDDISVTLYWEDTARSGIDDYSSTDLVVARYNGVDWVDEGQFAITSSNPGDVTSNVVVNYSPFSFASKNASVNPLPIDLLYFDAILDKRVTAQSGGTVKAVVDLIWATASEINNDYFTVEKSIDGVDFEFVTYVSGAGNSSQTIYYTAVDPDPYYGISYYRLKQTDYDGRYEYSNIVAVNLLPEKEYSIAVYPNPTNGEFYININGRKDDEVLVIVIDVLGKEHYSKVIILDEGAYILAVDPYEKLPSGVYIITATSKNDIYWKRIVISP